MANCYEKIAAFFEEHPDTREFATGQIAEVIGERVDYVYRLLSKMEKEGLIIKVKYGKRTVLWRVRKDP